MKINDKMPKFSETKKIVNEDKINSKTDLFNFKLNRIGESYQEKKLVDILDKINKQGEKLAKNIDIRELKHYKKLVSEFLYEATNKSHKFMKQSFLDKRGGHRVYAVVKKVDKKIEELTEEVIKEEKDNLRILDKIDDIKGLLLDILL